MSEKQQNKTVLLPDGSAENNKLNEEDKYESRTETDSGFLSSGNLLVSGEITTTEEQEPSIRKEDDKDKDKSDISYMHIDSGVDVCLSETFSSLSLKHPDLNDLNSKGEIKEYQRQQQQQQQQPQQQSISSKNRTIEEQPWQIYFEQDEDGDT